MREQDLWTGGIGFAAGLLLACLFDSPKPQHGGCGCGRPGSQTMGALGGDSKSKPYRRWLFCSGGVTHICTGEGMTTNPFTGEIIPIPYTTYCQPHPLPSMQGYCGDGDYFLTIPVALDPPAA